MQGYSHERQIEATGSEKIANEAINYVRRGGTLMIYAVYANQALVHWSPSKIFGDEIRVRRIDCLNLHHKAILIASRDPYKIIGSFCQTNCFPRAVAYLDSGKINVKGMVSALFGIS